MRTIKFRAWDGEAMWLYKGDCLYDLSTWLGAHSTLRKDKDSILMQFTGLTDKNGKEIYEGDIVKNTWEYLSHVLPPNEEEVYETESSIHSVMFDLGCFRLSGTNSNWGGAPLDACDELSVIGNIYEHPHLLEQQP